MYTRPDVYPDGSPIPKSLPPSYQPIYLGNAPSGQRCGDCKHFEFATKHCKKWDATVRPRWWCEGWTPMPLMSQSKIDNILLKKITTNTVEEHFSDSVNPTPIRYSAIENEEDIIKLNVPLIIRLLEFAREDSGKDIDLHIIVENLIDLSDEGDVLEMEDYDDIVKNLKMTKRR